jgi:hypothetical protein
LLSDPLSRPFQVSFKDCFSSTVTGFAVPPLLTLRVDPNCAIAGKSEISIGAVSSA